MNGYKTITIKYIVPAWYEVETAKDNLIHAAKMDDVHALEYTIENSSQDQIEMARNDGLIN